MITELSLSEYVISLRREFHRHPELSGQERWTADRIAKELAEIGIPFERVAGNIIGILACGEGKRLALRADFDALPLTELTDVPWKSENPGIMHACGHDAHAAILLAAARELYAQRESLHGTINFCFQQGEEIGIGAKECVTYLQQRGGVDLAIGLHIMPLLETGVIDLTPGFRANGAYEFAVDVTGKGGHGSRPDLSQNTLLAACDIVQHITAIPSNRHEAVKTCVISPCIMQVGEKSNILPETAHIAGTIRFCGEDDGEILKEKVTSTAAGIAAVYGASAQTLFHAVAPYPIYNQADAVTLAKQAACACGLCAQDTPPTSASDNFGEFLHAFPGFFAFLGARSNRANTSFVNHAPNFDIDESALPLGAAFITEFSKNYLLTGVAEHGS